MRHRHPRRVRSRHQTRPGHWHVRARVERFVEPSLRANDMETIRQPLDFIGANYYAPAYMRFDLVSQAHIAPARIAAIANTMDVAASTAPSLAIAMQEAAQFPAPRVLICGSFLLAGEALAAESA